MYVMSHLNVHLVILMLGTYYQVQPAVVPMMNSILTIVMDARHVNWSYLDAPAVKSLKLSLSAHNVIILNFIIFQE
jgi:hypothetical protein